MKHKIFLTIIAVALMSVSCNPFSFNSGGILKTGNGGIDWQQSSQLQGSNQSLNKASVSKIAPDPKLFGVLYAGTVDRGLFISRDGGTNWDELLGKISVFDFAVHPDNSNIIYAAGIFNDSGKVFGTRDGGNSWTEVYSAAELNNSVRSIAINPVNPEAILIGLSNGPLIRSDDGGNSWRLLENYNDRINQIVWNNEAVYIVVRTTGVFKSTDGGNRFSSVTKDLTAVTKGSDGYVFSTPVSTFNQLSIGRSSPNVMYITTDMGLYQSNDSGANWTQVSLPLRPQGTTLFAVSVAPSSAGVVYVSAGQYIYKTLDAGSTWLTSDTKSGNSVNTIAVNPDTPQVAYAGVYVPQ